jgi:hypothetical protein
MASWGTPLTPGTWPRSYIGKKEHAELCELFFADGCDVMLLPVVLRIAGTLFNCLDRATGEMDVPAKKRNYTASFTYTAYTVYKPYCPSDDSWKGRN